MTAAHGARPRLLFYGDDFTGATDALATAAEGGLRSLLFLRVPDAALLARAGPLDAVGIAGAARAMPPDEMARALAPVAALARRLRPRVLHYKTCSTFDSAPEVGNIGTAVAALRPAADVPWTAVVGGQPSLGRYCLFGQLFASAGTGGEVHRIDRHPTMSRHPVTPMGEADLRRHLAAQGLGPLALLPWTAHGDALGAPLPLRPALDAALASQPGAVGVLFDVGTAAQLRRVGALLASFTDEHTLLAVGPSSVVDALGARAAPRQAPTAPAEAPVLLLVGSQSPVTARQLAAARSYVALALDPAALLHGEPARRADAAEALARAAAARLKAGDHVLLRTAVPTATGAGPAFSGRHVAEASGQVLARVLALASLPRVGVAGGDTSSHAVQALDAWGLSHLGRLAPGVAMCRLHSDQPALDGMALMLKGGQMGGEDLFEALIHGTA